MKILNCILLSSLLLFAFPYSSVAQEAGTHEKDSIQVDAPFAFKGLSVSTDLFGYLYSLLDDGVSGEVALEANLGNRFFPVVEAGYGRVSMTDENFGIRYKSAAPFFRVGMNYNFSYRKEGTQRPNFVYGAFRFAFSKMKYDVSSPPLNDPVWGGDVTFSKNDIDGFCSWVEFGVGVKVKIVKRFHMGWCVRYKARVNVVNSDYSNVGYIPGFGKNRHTCFGATYSLIYDLPF